MTGLLFVIWTIGIALELSGVRWLQMFLFWPDHETWTPVIKTLWLGFRFDLLIVGFWLAPVVVFMLLRKLLTGKPLPHPGGVKIYLKTSWVLVSLIYFLDLVYFWKFKEHMWWEETSAFLFLQDTFWEGLEWWSWVVVALVIWGMIRIGNKLLESSLKRFRNYSYFSMIVIFLWTVFIARGTITSDHLRRNDCDWAKYSRTVHSLCMNPLYVFSKKR